MKNIRLITQGQMGDDYSDEAAFYGDFLSDSPPRRFSFEGNNSAAALSMLESMLVRAFCHGIPDEKVTGILQVNPEFYFCGKLLGRIESIANKYVVAA